MLDLCVGRFAVVAWNFCALAIVCAEQTVVESRCRDCKGGESHLLGATLLFGSHPNGVVYENSRQTAIASRSRSDCSYLLDRARAAGGRGIDYETAVLRGIEMGSFIVEFWYFLRVRKKFWLAPIMITMALFGALLIASQGSAIAPFIYTLF